MSRRCSHSPRANSPNGSADHPTLPGFWQRRWLERHFAHFSDEELAREARCSAAQVRAYPTPIGGQRSATQRQRIAQRTSTTTPGAASAKPSATPPACRTLDRIENGLSQLMAQLPADLADFGGMASRAACDLGLDPDRIDFGAPPMLQLSGSGGNCARAAVFSHRVRLL